MTYLPTCIEYREQRTSKMTELCGKYKNILITTATPQLDGVRGRISERSRGKGDAREGAEGRDGKSTGVLFSCSCAAVGSLHKREQWLYVAIMLQVFLKCYPIWLFYQ